MTEKEIAKVSEIANKLEAASFSNCEFSIVFGRKKMSQLEAYIKFHGLLEIMGELGYEWNGSNFVEVEHD